MTIDGIFIIAEPIKGKVFEYFCKDCKQLRLCFQPKRDKCGNCQSPNIIKGRVNGLDRTGLFNKYGRNTK